ncbi:MAG: hypothetical protein M5U11_04705 [Anaerolineales bacterium]|nr:hypothetical protein [Anaerolineales bacterium]
MGERYTKSTVAVPVGVTVGVCDGVSVPGGVGVEVYFETTTAVPVAAALYVAATIVSTAPTAWVGSGAMDGKTGAQASVMTRAATRKADRFFQSMLFLQNRLAGSQVFLESLASGQFTGSCPAG